MSFAYGLFLLAAFWSAVYLINTFLIEFSLTSALYAKILSKNGVSITPLQIRWYTVRCNRLFMKLSAIKPNFLKWWFNMGVLLGIVGQISSIFLLTYTLYDFFRKKPTREQILVPVLPGVNLPSDQTIYYLIALFLSGIFHEFGHAVAASREQVRVNGFGVFLMLVFPGAYVDLCSDHLMIISPLRQLRIFCAGVWHNFILVLLGLAMLQAHPHLVSALFDKGAHISSIAKDSSLVSIAEPNAIITGVGDCECHDSISYYECLFKHEKESKGYCMTVNDIKTMAADLIYSETSLKDCCSDNSTRSNFCFRWEPGMSLKENYGCLPARYVTGKTTCVSTQDCIQSSDLLNKALDFVCIRPVVDNTTRLIRIKHNKGPPILYLGTVKELIYSIVLEDYVPKSDYIPRLLNNELQLLLKYIVAFSGAIGVLNLVPCFALDGQYILASILNLNRDKTTVSFIDSNTKPDRQHPFLYVLLMLLGTSLLLLNILLAFASLAFNKFSSLFSN